MGWFLFFLYVAIKVIVNYIASKYRRSIETTTELEKLFAKSNLTSEHGIQLTIYDNEFKAAVDNGTIRNLVFLIPGLMASDQNVQEKYVKKYCESLKNSLYKYEPYTAICFNWKPTLNKSEELIKAAQWKGRDLARFIDKYLTEKVVKKIHFIAHELGCVLVETVGGNLSRRPIDFIFALNQKSTTPIEKSGLLLKPSSAKMVQAVYSGYIPLPQVQRNFYILPKNEDEKEIIIYEVFSQVIAANGNVHKGVPCSNSEEYVTGKCKKEQVSMWSNELIGNNTKFESGKFFLTRA